MCVAFMHMIAETGVGRNDEKITVGSFNSFIATFLYLVSKMLILCCREIIFYSLILII